MSVSLVDSEPETGDAFLSVRDLRVHFPTGDGLVKSVDGLSFDVARGRVLGIVGESGSGKSVTSQAIMGLHKGSQARITGEIWLDGTELISASEEQMRRLRGDKMSMVFQDPLSSMHPFYRIGDQILEAYRVHNRVSKSEGKKRVIEMLDRVGIPNPDKRYSDYPHQFSGGMRQRAMIAMALVCNPKLLIADEPTTALDVTVQAQILELMKDLQREFDSAIILITHDLGVVAETCDDVVVMYGGQCVETGTVDEIFYQPEMPYTWGLLRSMPRLDRTRQERLQPIPGQPPSLIQVPKGCVFNPRCTFTEHVRGDACVAVHPELLHSPERPESHKVRCHIQSSKRQQIWVDQIKPSLT
ncbi:ABC transporter ATP-binding protein [Jatrophihabitans telluris]|uniref:ABC transporter ATP-binding protein n=1 Tax=Jatrophihabitans telluris TaxID=2038343 RepID=A0ABY4QVM7_9ACTN|nr:ABC transporter ATP-binding protein [Jatrophihabitans telluris]UQX87716.1 ABC transporter ATP-binding protein [Jatrophihabitans telluris]